MFKKYRPSIKTMTNLVVFLIGVCLLSCWTLLEGAELLLPSDIQIKRRPDILNATDQDFLLYIDPPNGHSSPAVLGVFIRANDPNVLIYYNDEGKDPVALSSSTPLTYDKPYVQLDTPFKARRERTLIIIAVVKDDDGFWYRSEQTTLNYNVEGSARPDSFGFLVPGIESGGYFVRYGIEMVATARAQVAGGQEFADFFTNLSIGTYDKQVSALDLLDIDPELQGFEGGFPVNISWAIANNTIPTNLTYTIQTKHYGFLIPFHNGDDFFGKLVRVDLREGMNNITECRTKIYTEHYSSNGTLVIGGTVPLLDSCVAVLDLASVYPQAKGFRRGFVNYPYGYLSAGHYSTVVRIDLENFALNTTKFIDLSLIDPTYGGYSGGFADGTWACFNPYLSYAGPVGGIRSALPVDANRLRPYYYATMLCLNATAWETNNTAAIAASIRTIDLSAIEDTLRGFSEALRVGRFAYLSPLSNAESQYSSKLIRISLGEVDIGTTLTLLAAAGKNVRTIVDILDLSKKNEAMRGYSGLFNAGKYLFLVPFRNSYEPKNGQRGHGTLTRLNMNDFGLNGIDFIDIPTTIRTQIPSFPDFKLRGFMGGFASGYYGMLVPFFNADFNGRIARFKTIESTLDTNLQELDLMGDRRHRNVFKGYRGGFPSLWQGVVA